MTELATPPVEREQDVKRISHWIGGRIVEGDVGAERAGLQPGARASRRARSTSRRSRRWTAAVQAAKEAFPAWRAMSLSKRTAIFFSIRDLVDEHREDLARILTAEHGKVLSDAMGEVARGLEVIEYCCGIPELLKGDFSEQASTGIDVYSIRQPLGVVAGITPFNFPAMVPDVDVGARARVRQHVRAEAVREGSLGIALHGASCCRRPACPTASSTSCTATRSRSTRCSQHPDISAVSFVGSTPIAKYVYETGHRDRQARARRSAARRTT